MESIQSNLNYNTMDFDLSLGMDGVDAGFAQVQPAAGQMANDQSYMKPSLEGNTSSFFYAGDEGIDTTGGQFDMSGAQQSQMQLV